MPKLIAENPPESTPRKSKYRDIIEEACNEPYTWFRINQSYKAMTSVNYLKNRYANHGIAAERDMHLEFKAAPVGNKVNIWVCAFPKEG